jgi:DNA topoisomerase I
LTVQSVESKPAARNPSAPFMTSTLQQEASRKFGMGAKQAMGAAQRLYEAGHITYMRTDGIDMAPEAVTAARTTIKDRYGDKYVPETPRVYKNKAKNAQEAHECIRPTDMAKAAEDLRLDGEQKKLYDLIWKRTIASQMAAARLERTTVDVGSADGQVVLRATGQVIMFDGFLKLYEEGRDDEDSDEGRLPQITQGEAAGFVKGAFAEAFAKAAASGDEVIERSATRVPSAVTNSSQSVLGAQHFTQPPPRYTEATLVKRMEELGIGRPSTYASIMTTIVDREYVRKDKNRLFPEDKGRLVTAFLSNYFRKYVEYDFTADLEGQLDDVSAGDRDYKEVLARFWRDFSAAIAETADLRIGEVLTKIDEFLAPHLYPPRADGSDPRVCPVCGDGRLHLKTARSGGAFIGCGNYPECRYTRPISIPGGDEGAVISPDGQVLGVDDEGEQISLRTGRFGPYVQRGEATEELPKPPRASLPKGWAPEAIDLDKALTLLSLPRQVGPHPDDGVMIEAAIGRYGPYVKHNKTYANLPDVEEVFTIGMNRAVEVLANKYSKARVAAEPIKDLGEHPEGGPMTVMPGRYGPYIKWGKINATVPKDVEPADVTVEQAIELLTERAAKTGTKKKAPAKKAAPKAAAAKKPAAKKAPAKTATKTAAKKTSTTGATKKAASKKAAKPAEGDDSVE